MSSLETVIDAHASSEDDLDITAERTPRLERLGFPAGMKPFREALVVTAVVAVLVTWIYRLWNAHLKVPFNYSGDSISAAAYTKGIIENGWYLNNPRLAAPFHADWRDFPFGGENLHWLGLKIIGTITGNYAITMNLYFLLGFFLIAFSAYFVSRYLAFGRAVSLVVAVLFAFLPFHAYRNEAHITRGAYFPVPLAILVILWVAHYKTDFFRTDDSKLRPRWGRLAFAVGVGVIVASTDDQNAAFMVSILAIIAIVAALRDRDWRPVAVAGVLAAGTFGMLFVNNAPFVISRIERGPNTEVANRPLSDQDYYGLRPVDLVLPAPGHRVHALNTLATKGAKGQVTNSESPGSALGLVGSVGLVFSIGAAIALALGSRRPREDTEFAATLGVVNLIAILIGAIGGFAFLLALSGFGLYRTWNRISVFIAFSALLASAILLTKLFRWIRGKAKTRGLGVAIVAAIVVVLIVGGTLDQTTPKYIPNYKNTAVRFDTDATFFHDVENMLPPGSMVFQLPVSQFPEAGTIANMGDYAEFVAYLHTKKLRWSYGGIKGRNEGDWQKNLSIYDPVALLAQIAAVGFQGVVIDRTGFTDGGNALLQAAEPYTGAPKVRSADDRLLYLDLTGLRARLDSALGADAVKQSSDAVLGNTIQWTGFSFPEPLCDGKGGLRRWAVSPHASVTLNNTTNANVTVDASSAFEANPKATNITISYPGFSQTVPITSRWHQTITLPPGKTTIQFSFPGPRVVAPNDARKLYFSLMNPDFGAPFASPVVAWAHKQPPICKPS